MPTWQGGNFSLDAGTIKDQHINSGAAISVDKQQHAYKPYSDFGFKIGDTPAGTVEFIVFVATNAGVIRSFEALLNATGTVTSITFDLLKNGVSVLTAPVSITNANSNRQVVTGTLSTTTFVAGDVFSMKMIETTNTGAQGPCATAGLSENAGP